MAYTSYEILPARTINNRIVPRLWKLIRNDGTFDLYCLSSLQHNCIQYLTTRNEAGVCSCRWNSSDKLSLGEWNVESNDNSFIKLGLYRNDSTRYGAIPHTAFRLKLNNKANLYPYKIEGYCYSDHNGGDRQLQVYNGSSWITKVSGSGNYAQNTLWQMNLSDLSSVFDWKDYSQLWVMCRAWDTSKFTNAQSRVNVTFVHRYTDGHPLHRYYR